jgi:hypothetical protein
MECGLVRTKENGPSAVVRAMRPNAKRKQALPGAFICFYSWSSPPRTFVSSVTPTSCVMSGLNCGPMAPSGCANWLNPSRPCRRRQVRRQEEYKRSRQITPSNTPTTVNTVVRIASESLPLPGRTTKGKRREKQRPEERQGGKERRREERSERTRTGTTRKTSQHEYLPRVLCMLRDAARSDKEPAREQWAGIAE